MKILIDKEKLVLTPVDKLNPNPKNRNKHTPEQIARLCELIKYQGFRQPIIVSNRSGLIVVGHGRLEAAKQLGLPHVPVLFQDFESEEQEYAFCVSDNAIQSWSELDLSGINADLPDLGPDFDIDLLGIKDFKLDLSESDSTEEPKGSMSDKFLVPPFSVLDARQGYWQDRKRQWLALGIKSELGRGGGSPGTSTRTEAERTASFKNQDKLNALRKRK